jgi:hypothetical protein
MLWFHINVTGIRNKAKLALTSPTSGGRSVNIVRLQINLFVGVMHKTFHIILIPVPFCMTLDFKFYRCDLWDFA